MRKDKYDPKSDRWRLTSHFDAVTPRSLGAGSINDLCYTPRLLRAYLSSAQLRDTIAHLYQTLGPGVKMFAVDIPQCFRQYCNRLEDLHLFVYRVETEEHGVEYFVDLAFPFGWQPSEWGHSCALGLFEWRLRQRGLSGVAAYVDNFFDIWHDDLPGPSSEERGAQLLDALTEMGVKTHEHMGPARIKSLGWVFDTSGSDAPRMICADDKFEYVCAKLLEWSSCDMLSVKDLEKAVGILSFIADGFPAGRAHVGALIYLRSKGTEKAKARGVRTDALRVGLSQEAKAAFSFWASSFPRWGKSRPVFLDFGPMAGAEVYGRVDASLISLLLPK